MTGTHASRACPGGQILALDAESAKRGNNRESAAMQEGLTCVDWYLALGSPQPLRRPCSRMVTNVASAGEPTRGHASSRRRPRTESVRSSFHSQSVVRKTGRVSDRVPVAAVPMRLEEERQSDPARWFATPGRPP